MFSVEAQGRIRNLGYRAACLTLFLVALFLPATVRADTSAATQPASVTVDELGRLVEPLQADKARAKLAPEPRALIAAQRRAAPEKPAATAMFSQLSQQIDAMTGEILAGVAVIVDAPRLFGWARHQ